MVNFKPFKCWGTIVNRVRLALQIISGSRSIQNLFDSEHEMLGHKYYSSSPDEEVTGRQAAEDILFSKIVELEQRIERLEVHERKNRVMG